MAAITGREHGGYRVAERLIVLPPMLEQREPIMTPAEIEGRRVIALRLFDALCAHYPEGELDVGLNTLSSEDRGD